jgi:16S rRNA (guanine966-N2)-methyltransferase
MRIIGGRLRGRRLFSVKGFRVRPTTDKHRESIFNIIAPHLKDSTVLDLFAGTGALGIEALSRGAGFAVFVDLYPDAVSTIFQNIQYCRLESVTKVFRCNVLKKLNCLQSYSFDLVFMDPPYNAGYLEAAFLNLRRCGCLKNEALIVVEHAFDETIPDNLSCFKLFDQRRYGKTLVSFFYFMLMEPA